MTSYIIKSMERAYPWLLLSPVILPVVVWGGFIYPYLVPKTLLFYALSLLTLGAFVLLATHAYPFYYARLSRWETWIPALLLLLAYLTSLIGTDFYRSFWSLFVRGDGLLMLTCAVASFYLILLYTDRAFFERLLRAVALVGSFVAIYGIGEWFINGGRIGGLLGNAAFFASYLSIAFFATLAAAISLSGGWRRVAFAGAVLQIIAIVLTATRGTILALLLAGGAALVFAALKGKGRIKSAARYGLISLIVLASLFFVFRTELAQNSFEPVRRIAAISISDGTVSSRLFIWKNMVTEIQKSPLLGVGAEHIDVLFNRFYDPTQIYEQWFDRSHNAFLDYAAQFGIGGLLLYLVLIATFFSTAWRLRRDESRIAGIFALLAITYVVQNFFVFDTVSSFWLLLALLATLIAASTSNEREVLSLPTEARYAAWSVALILVYFILPASVHPALAAYDLREAYKYQLTDVAKEVSHLSHGIARGTYADIEYGYQAYDMYALVQAAALSGQVRIDAYQSTLSVLTANFNRYEYDARTALYLAQVLSLAPPEMAIDREFLGGALARAIEGSPKRSQSWYILVNLSISNANEYPPRSKERVAGYAAAKDLLTRYLALVPTSAQPHFILAQLLYASGDTAGAFAEAAKGKTSYTSDLETATRAASYYEIVLDLPNAAFFLAEIVRLDPTNVAAKSDLEKIQDYEHSKK